MTIAVTGSLAFDYIMTFPGSFTEHILPDQLENISVSFLVDSMRREPGGNAGNVAYSLALLKQPARLMAAIGQDGKEYINRLRNDGVDTSGTLILEDEFTASFFVSNDNHNRQIANFYPGAMGRSAEISFHTVDPASIELVTVSPSSPDGMLKYVQECKELDIKYMYDPSQQLPRMDGATLRDCINGAAMLTVNDYEFELIKSKTHLSDDDLRAMVDILIVTRGEAGSTIYENGVVVHVAAAKPSQVADPTGGGDAYRSGLLAGWRNGLSWLESGQLGALAATYAIELVGTQRHRYTIDEFAARYFDNFSRSTEIEAFFEKLS